MYKFLTWLANFFAKPIEPELKPDPAKPIVEIKTETISSQHPFYQHINGEKYYAYLSVEDLSTGEQVYAPYSRPFKQPETSVLLEPQVINLPRSTKTRWSVDDDKLLLKMWKLGQPVSFIASSLNRSPDAVKYRLYTFNISTKGHMLRETEAMI